MLPKSGKLIEPRYFWVVASNANMLRVFSSAGPPSRTTLPRLPAARRPTVCDRRSASSGDLARISALLLTERPLTVSYVHTSGGRMSPM